MPFNQKDAEDLLARCRRHCCVCYRFCGSKIELHHIMPKSAGGPDDIDNAIPLCFDCHAEIESYNPTHPRGRKFSGSELRQHRDQWLSVCQERPEALLQAPRNVELGALQSLVDELTVNLDLLESSSSASCRFRSDQLSRAIAEGALAVLEDSILSAVLKAYRYVAELNFLVEQRVGAGAVGNQEATARARFGVRTPDAKAAFAAAIERLANIGRERSTG